MGKLKLEKDNAGVSDETQRLSQRSPKSLRAEQTNATDIDNQHVTQKASSLRQSLRQYIRVSNMNFI